MEAKEKAKELVQSFIEIMPNLQNQTGLAIMLYGKLCAIMLCQQMINEILDNYDTLHAMDRIIHYKNVKTEINNL
jgi:hypothetical protein